MPCPSSLPSFCHFPHGEPALRPPATTSSIELTAGQTAPGNFPATCVELPSSSLEWHHGIDSQCHLTRAKHRWLLDDAENEHLSQDRPWYARKCPNERTLAEGYPREGNPRAQYSSRTVWIMKGVTGTFTVLPLTVSICPAGCSIRFTTSADFTPSGTRRLTSPPCPAHS